MRMGLWMLPMWLACTTASPPLVVAVDAERRGALVVVSVTSGHTARVEGRHRLEDLTVSPGQITQVETDLGAATVYVYGVPADATRLRLSGTLVVATLAGEHTGGLPREARIR